MRTRSLLLTISLLVAACGENKNDGNGDATPGYDQEQLDRARAAVPAEDRLTASGPQATGGLRDLGDPAEYPKMAAPIVLGVNGAAHLTVRILRAVVDLPPTVYNSETKEFFWGPWKKDDGHGDDFGYVGAYIRENPEGDDFKYSYALLRLASNDTSEWTSVIWGGANPDPNDDRLGNGVTMWDLTANDAFAATNDPDYVQGSLSTGRFVAFYGREYSDDENDGDATFTFNVAVFRSFNDPNGDNPSDTLDLDYLYGKYDGAVTVSFADFEATADVLHDTAAQETLDVRLAFVHAGTGRADVQVSGGDAGTSTGEGTECWDTSLDQTYFKLELVSDSDERTLVQQNGEGPEACGETFAPGIPDSVPSRAQVQDLIDVMASLAETGIYTPAE